MKTDRIIADLERLERLDQALKRRPRRDTIEMQQIAPGIYAPRQRTIADIVRDIKSTTEALKGLK